MQPGRGVLQGGEAPAPRFPESPVGDDRRQRTVERRQDVGAVLGDTDAPPVVGLDNECELEVGVGLPEWDEDDVVVADGVDPAGPQRGEHVFIDVLRFELDHLRTVERRGQVVVRGCPDGGNPLAGQTRGVGHGLTAAHQDALVEDGVRPGEIDLLHAGRDDPLAAQHGVDLVFLGGRQHIAPGHDDPLEVPVKFGRDELADGRLVAGPAARRAGKPEQGWRVGVDACQSQ